MAFGYESERRYLTPFRCCGLSELIRMHPEELFDSPDFITRDTINDEEITKQGPVYNYKGPVNDPGGEKYFVYNGNNKIT